MTPLKSYMVGKKLWYYIFCNKSLGGTAHAYYQFYDEGGGVAQWLGRRISDQGVPGSNPGWCTFRCGLEPVTFTLLSTG